jgi:hypothetical protein
MRVDSIAPSRRARRRALALSAIALALCCQRPTAGATPSDAAIAGLVHRHAYDDLRQLGRGVLPVLTRLYAISDPATRKDLAGAFYALGWESPEAKRALSRDLGTPDTDLRIVVQYALGKVSGDDEVVDRLLQAMRTDPSPLIRDKAACALTYDQPHLGRAGLIRLYAGLIAALEDEQAQVRSIAILALEVRTGQTKGFVPLAPPQRRAPAVAKWRRWLTEYEAQP